MDLTGLVIFLAIGAVAGWLAGNLMKGGGFGLLGNIVVGIVGAVLGGVRVRLARHFGDRINWLDRYGYRRGGIAAIHCRYHQEVMCLSIRYYPDRFTSSLAPARTVACL